jgi:hypothetical protein
MAAMTQQELVDELCGLAEAVGLTVRREPLDGAAGGLCRLKGRAVLLVDTSQPADQQADLLAAALVEVDRASAAGASRETAAGPSRLEEMFILPQVRDYLDRFQSP